MDFAAFMENSTTNRRSHAVTVEIIAKLAKMRLLARYVVMAITIGISQSAVHTGPTTTVAPVVA